MSETIYVIKIGGHIIDDAQRLHNFLSKLTRLKQPFVLVHGGGKVASEISRRMGIEPVLLQGRRVTNAQTLQITVMVYAGWINKDIVAYLNSKDVRAIGLSGVDAGMIHSRKRPVKEIDFGFVGDIQEVNVHILADLIKSGYVPVVSPVTADKNGQLLNTNADTVAAAIAGGLAQFAETRLIYCFERKGVLKNQSNPDTRIPLLTPEMYQSLRNDNIISGGMVPKIDTAFHALENGVSSVAIIHAYDILDYMHGTPVGTEIRLDKEEALP